MVAPLLPNIYKPINLQEYEPGMQETIQVQVFPLPDDVIQEMKSFGLAVDEEPKIKWAARVWKDWSLAEVLELYQYCQAVDPQLWNWLIGRSIRIVFQYMLETGQAFGNLELNPNRERLGYTFRKN